MIMYKRSFVTFVIVLCLFIAVSYSYLMWWEAQSPLEADNGVLDVMRPDVIEPVDEEEAERMKKIDEGMPQDYFIEYRFKRDQTRSQRIDILAMVINNPNTATEIRMEAQKELERIAQLTETEMIVENLLTAKGFKDALLFWHGDSVNVIIRATDLTQLEAIQIRDIVSRALKVPMEEVVIIEK